MTTSYASPVPAPSTPTTATPGTAPRQLRRRATGRVAAGVCGGLGDYTGVDPVVFRVLFTLSSVFGGAGAIAYAVLWAVVPVEDHETALLDSWVDGLRGTHATGRDHQDERAGHGADGALR